MQAIMEPIFEIPYLIGVVFLGILTIRNARNRKQYILFGIMAIILGFGDAFHLVPRMFYLITTGTTILPEQAIALGIGKLITSITMTFFYLILYHVWQLRYQEKSSQLLTICIYVLAAIRIVLCLLPQNQWTSIDAPLTWGIYRNIPFVLMGILIIYLYYSKAKANNDHSFRYMWLAITLSFLFYIPVVLFADYIPMMGMLMIPKTCAYVWIVMMGYLDSKK